MVEPGPQPMWHFRTKSKSTSFNTPADEEIIAQNSLCFLVDPRRYRRRVKIQEYLLSKRRGSDPGRLGSLLIELSLTLWRSNAVAARR